MSKHKLPTHYSTSVKELLQTYKILIESKHNVDLAELELAKEIYHQVVICDQSYRKIAEYLTSIKTISHTEVMKQYHKYEALITRAKGGGKS